MILLDTNVLSELMKSAPNPLVIAWLDRQPRTSVWTTSVTILEIRFGMQVLPAGKRRDQLISAFEIVLNQHIQRRVANFDTAAAAHAANLMASRQQAGGQQELRDTMIAGIALAANATLATGNTRHFENTGVTLINPWHDAG